MGPWSMSISFRFLEVSFLARLSFFPCKTLNIMNKCNFMAQTRGDRMGPGTDVLPDMHRAFYSRRRTSLWHRR